MRTLTLLLVLVLASISAAEAASTIAADRGTVVAVVDTGVSLDGARVLAGADLVDGDGDAADENGHGTAVAATVAAACPDCSILPVRVLSRAGSAPWSRVAAGIVWAVDRGAQVVNVSISGPGGSPALRGAVRYAAERDVLVVAAAGNAGSTQRQYPAAYDGVVAVAAADAGGRLYDWSSRGAWVDLAAPGCETLPVAHRTAWACGTSFAAPFAAGTAAKARAADPSSSALEIARALPSLVHPGAGAAPRVTVSGSPRPGATLRASLPGHRSLGTQVRWFRCATGASPHECVPASSGASYRVRAGDSGTTLVARAVTKPFGGLWLATSARLAVS